jgi:hypothetical protein
MTVLTKFIANILPGTGIYTQNDRKNKIFNTLLILFKGQYRGISNIGAVDPSIFVRAVYIVLMSNHHIICYINKPLMMAKYYLKRKI